MTLAQSSIGIDISQAFLDIFDGAGAEYSRIANDDASITASRLLSQHVPPRSSNPCVQQSGGEIHAGGLSVLPIGVTRGLGVSYRVIAASAPPALQRLGRA